MIETAAVVQSWSFQLTWMTAGNARIVSDSKADRHSVQEATTISLFFSTSSRSFMPSWRPITYLRTGGEPRSDDAARRGVDRGVSVQFWPKRQARRHGGMRAGDFNKVHGERFAQLPETASLSGGARNACCLGSICCIAD